MEFLKKFVVSYRIEIGLFILYFLLLLINLTLLPIFNDESIYLDWGWSHTHMPGTLYDALLDAKQPLMVWIFGLFENFFTDPLFAGRFVSVLIGEGTMLGIYILTKKVFNRQTAGIAMLIYAITPIFVFYNRQALMESAVACAGIWTCIALYNLLQQNSTKNSIMLGIVWGIGFFIKTSSLLFIVSSIAIIGYYIFKKKKTAYIASFFIACAAFICVDLLLFINPVFWQTLSLNNRYAFSIAELFTFPIATWWTNFTGFFEIGFVFMTPLVFAASIVGVYLILRKRFTKSYALLTFFFLALLMEVLGGKSQSQRYLVPFLPFLVIPAAYAFYRFWNALFLGKIIVIASLLLPLGLTFLQINNPEQYIQQMSAVSQYSQKEYISGQTSGHGVNESIRYIKEQTNPNQPVMVLFGFNIGNPESAVDLYAQKTPNLAPLHIDAKLFAGIEQYQCLTSQYPAFLVSRNGELLGMERYFTLEKSFPNPDPNYSIKLYTLKKDCKGNTASLSDIYQPSMVKLFQIKNGIYY